MSFLLAIVVALTGFTAASSRTAERILTETVICQGSALVKVAVDSQGRPVGPAQPCPEALGALFLADGVAGALPPLPARPARPLPATRESAVAARAVPISTARGPPRVGASIPHAHHHRRTSCTSFHAPRSSRHS
ncbi:MAG: hypothetical protein FJX19_02250 [Alphaproteobacteria bacterium]|nr:hypothetical protein [Alphaproteobacteria bacterium]